MKVLIYIITLSSIAGQTIRLIDGHSGDPVENVNVFVGNVGTTSDKYGFCDLGIFNKADDITFSMIGYSTMTLPILEIPEVVYLQNEFIPMESINVLGKDKKSKKRFYRLERDVRKVYPYAKKTSELLVEYSSIIDSLEQYSGLNRYYNKRKIFSKIEDELISKYGYSIKKLKKGQGRILIRLIDRETGYTSYQIIKEFRGLFFARFWQITARLFSQNLKSRYNPDNGEDKMIEHIIKTIFKKERQS